MAILRSARGVLPERARTPALAVMTVIAGASLGLATPTGVAGAVVLTGLPPLTGGTATQGFGINDAGVVVGTGNSSTNLDRTHAALWMPTVGGYLATDLDAATGGGTSEAFAINSTGTVVGDFTLGASTTPHAGVWNPSGIGYSFTDLGTLPGGGSSTALGIDGSGRVVGYSSVAGGGNHAVLWAPPSGKGGYGATDLGVISGGSDSVAFGINASGMIVGHSTVAGSSHPHPVLWTPPAGVGAYTISELPSPAGGTGAQALAINDSGQVVGDALTSEPGPNGIPNDLVHHPVFWKSGGGTYALTALDGLNGSTGPRGDARGINSAGRIVGSVNDGANDHPVAWGAGASGTYVATDLGMVARAGGGARGINAAGRITGVSGGLNGMAQAFVTAAGPVAAVVGSDNTAFAKFGPNPFAPRGGRLIAAPAVVAVPGPSGLVTPLYVGVGTDHKLYVRSDTIDWRELVPSGSGCWDSPAATVTPDGSGGNTLTVACAGGDGALYYAEAPVNATALPVIAGAAPFHGLGGALIAGPAIASVNGSLIFFAEGTNHFIYSKAVTDSSFTKLPAACIGHPAAAALGADAFLACQGMDGRLYYSKNASGAGWGIFRSAGGLLIDGPGLATIPAEASAPAAPASVTAFVEGTDQKLYHTVISADGTSSSDFMDDGGVIMYGAGAAGLPAP